MLVSDWGKKNDTKKEGSAQENKGDESVADVLVENPICHKLVPKQQAIRLNSTSKNEIMYFCSEECCNIFVSQEGEKE